MTSNNSQPRSSDRDRSHLPNRLKFNQAPYLIRWLIILTAIGLTASFAIGMLLKRQQPANARSIDLPRQYSLSDRAGVAGEE